MMVYGENRDSRYLMGLEKGAGRDKARELLAA